MSPSAKIPKVRNDGNFWSDQATIYSPRSSGLAREFPKEYLRQILKVAFYT